VHPERAPELFCGSCADSVVFAGRRGDAGWKGLKIVGRSKCFSCLGNLWCILVFFLFPGFFGELRAFSWVSIFVIASDWVY